MTMAEIMEALRAGGFTIWLTEEKSTGYLVGGACPATVRESVHEVTGRDIANIMIRALGTADTIGGWIDEDDEGRTHLDGSDWFPDLDSATALARERGERAIWDIAKGISVYV